MKNIYIRFCLNFTTKKDNTQNIASTNFFTKTKQ